MMLVIPKYKRDTTFVERHTAYREAVKEYDRLYKEWKALGFPDRHKVARALDVASKELQRTRNLAENMLDKVTFEVE